MMNRTKTNSPAIISLVLGILSILVPIIGVALGVIGVVFSRKAAKEISQTNEEGRGLATAGLICSVVGITIQFIGLLNVVIFYSMTPASS
jgi:ABC-type nickel/cobalt efflux system permease component RcnA